MNKPRGINRSEGAHRAFEERLRQEEMAKASEGIDRIRASSKASDWSGAREIRKWRDAGKSS